MELGRGSLLPRPSHSGLAQISEELFSKLTMLGFGIKEMFGRFRKNRETTDIHRSPSTISVDSTFHENSIIFLSYAHEDKDKIQHIYRELKRMGISPWMDHPPYPFEREGIPAGADWDQTIRDKLKNARLIYAFFSNSSIDKEGYVQREYRLALDRMNEMPPGRDLLIPILLEDCRPPEITVGCVSLHSRQWYRYYRDGIKGLVDRARGDSFHPATLDIPIPSKDQNVLLETDNFFVLSAAYKKYDEEYSKIVKSIGAPSPHFEAGYTALAKRKRFLNDLRNPQAQLAFREAAEAFIKESSNLEAKVLALRQISEARSEYFQRALVAASDWDLLNEEGYIKSNMFQEKLRDVLETRKILSAIPEKLRQTSTNIMKIMRGTTEFNKARRLISERIGELEDAIESQIKATEQQEVTVRKLIDRL